MTKKDTGRYSRQTLFAPIGERGQRMISKARVCLIGCGALGNGIANSFVRAGVGFIRIVDSDRVELSNLQRQSVFDEADAKARRFKAKAAAARLAKVNSEVEIEPIVARVGADNIVGFIRDCDLVMDGTDNFDTRAVINDACARLKKPWVYGGCVMARGLVKAVIPGRTSCLRCVFCEAPEPGTVQTADTAGIINSIPYVISAIQSAEALKILTGNFKAVSGDLLTVDLWSGRFCRVSSPRNTKCQACGRKKS